MNSCYANIELLYHPDLRGKPVAVGGDPELRHGIILAKSIEAKRAGVKTGMALWEAKQLCPEIIFIPPHYDRYMRFSRLAREIYGEYTDLIEPFGIDECWFDISASTSIKGDGKTVAEEIRSRIKRELGVTVSIGVSWNKIFAKFGSDYKKPDAVTEIDVFNYRKIVWPRPVADLIYVVRATKRKLNNCGIYDIGELAGASPELLKKMLGKMGLVLHAFANGADRTPVSPDGAAPPVKSIGNGITAPRELENDEDVKLIIYMLAESVGARLREHHFAGRTVEISVRDRDLCGFTRQMKIKNPTNITDEIARNALILFREHYSWKKSVRSLTVRVADLGPEKMPYQTDIFEDPVLRDKMGAADEAVDSIRKRFGYFSVQRGMMLKDRELAYLDAKSDNVIHPRGYFERTGTDDVFGR